MGGQIDFIAEAKTAFLFGPGFSPVLFFFFGGGGGIIIPKDSQSSQNQQPWESMRAVATRAAGHLREWALI